MLVMMVGNHGWNTGVINKIMYSTVQFDVALLIYWANMAKSSTLALFDTRRTASSLVLLLTPVLLLLFLAKMADMKNKTVLNMILLVLSHI